MDYILIRCTEQERTKLMYQANMLIDKLDKLREDKTPVTIETVLAKCALLNLEQNLEYFLKGMGLT